MKTILLNLLFGKRKQGVKVNQPSLRTVRASDLLPENQWMEHVKFGSRYGHRGSFYQYS